MPRVSRSKYDEKRHKVKCSLCPNTISGKPNLVKYRGIIRWVCDNCVSENGRAS